MNRSRRPATLLNTVSFRVDADTFARLVAAAEREDRLLSTYIRMLVERAASDDRQARIQRQPSTIPRVALVREAR